MTAMTDEWFEELAALAALDDLAANERAELEAELARRGVDGAAVVRRLNETAGLTALAAPAVEPPPALRDRVLGGIQGDRPGAAAVSRPRWWAWAAAASIAAILVAALAAWGLRESAENERLRAELDDAGARLAAADSAAAAAHNSTRAELQALREDLDFVAGPAAVHGLASTGRLPGAGARVFLDPATGRAILFAFELPILPPDTIYELWAIDDGTPRAAGVFRPGPDGRARLEIADAELLEGIDALAVTVEPAPGVDAPTSEPILLSQS